MPSPISQRLIPSWACPAGQSLWLFCPPPPPPPPPTPVVVEAVFFMLIIMLMPLHPCESVARPPISGLNGLYQDLNVTDCYQTAVRFTAYMGGLLTRGADSPGAPFAFPCQIWSWVATHDILELGFLPVDILPPTRSIWWALASSIMGRCKLSIPSDARSGFTLNRHTAHFVWVNPY